MPDLSEYLEKDLSELLQVVLESDVRELEVTVGSTRVRLHRALSIEEDGTGVIQVEPEATVLGPTAIEITAPLVGTFYRATTPGTPPLVSEGSLVTDDTIVGIVEALQVLTEVEAGCTGIISKVLATDGEPVEYGQRLFEVSPGD